MLRRIVTVVRSWFGLVAPDTSGAERRVWVRSLSDVETNCKLADAPATGRMLARIRNISRGGAKLLVPQPLPPGALLSIEMPGAGPGDEYFVLACVIHSAAQPNAEWALGCTFARELSEEEVQSLISRPIAPLESDERSVVRLPCPTKASYQFVNVPDRPAGSAKVLDLSPKGIALGVTETIDVGTLLNLELQSASGTARVTRLASVTRLSPLQAGEWSVGCNFISQLNDQDVRALL
jgi:PilZ domain